MIKLTNVTEDLELDDNKYYYTRVELTGAGCDLVSQLIPEACSKGVEIHCLQTGSSCVSAYYKTLMKPVDMAYLKHFVDMFVDGIEVKIQLVKYE